MNDKPESEFELLTDGPRDADRTLITAHGDGRCMSSPFVEHTALALAQAGLRVVRFEFPHMAETRKTGNRKPPNRERLLLQTSNRIIDQELR